MSEQPESHRVQRQRLAEALEESRRVEKELNARDVGEDAAFADRLAERLEQPSEGEASR